MAISKLSSDSKNGAASKATSGTHAFTCPAGTTLLIAFVTLRGDATTPASCSATYNGVSMTQTGLKSYSNRGVVVGFYLQSPPTGSSYTFSASWDQSATYIFHLDTFDGTDTGTAPFGWIDTSGLGTSGSLTVSGMTAGDWAVDCFAQNTSGTLTEGAGQTLMNAQQSTSNGSDDHMSETSYEEASGTSVGMDYSSSLSANYVYGAFAIKMASAGVSAGNWFLMF